eukprot:5425824-Pleurochrysis_carterae.AAC.3
MSVCTQAYSSTQSGAETREYRRSAHLDAMSRLVALLAWHGGSLELYVPPFRAIEHEEPERTRVHEETFTTRVLRTNTDIIFAHAR